MLRILKSICLAVLLITAYSCKKDNDDDVTTGASSATGETQVDVTNQSELAIVSPTFTELDGADVGSKIAISGSSKKTGIPPAPTGESEAPTVYGGSDQNLRVRNGHKMNLVINGYNLENVEGIYLQVDGSDDYFEVPVTVNSNDNYRLSQKGSASNALGRTKKVSGESNNNIDLQIEIPSSITQGTFCVSYCLYTTDGQVGAVVRRCIDVQEFGSTNVDFLGTWDFTKAVASIDGTVEEIEKGKNNTWFSEGEENSCGVEDQSIIDHLILTFTSNGGISMDQKFTDSYFADWEEGTYDDDDDNWTPGTPICSSFTTDTDEYVENGAWTYNGGTQTLTIFFYEDENLYEPYFVEFKLVQGGNDMSLVLDFAEEGEDFNIVYDFVKK